MKRRAIRIGSTASASGRVGPLVQSILVHSHERCQDELARKRLKVICHASDGFAIAEQDLQLRGPGDFFGTRQHGLPDLRMINLYRDRDVITDVEHALTQLIDKDPDLNSPEHQLLRQVIADRYPAVFSQIGL